MDSPNLVIVEVTESPKEGREAEKKKQGNQQQQQQEQECQDEHHEEKEEEEEEKEGDMEAAQKSVISSTKPEPGEIASSTPPDQLIPNEQHTYIR